SITVNEKVLKDIDNLVDNISIKNRSQAIEYVLQNSLGEKKIAVVLAGGEEKKIKIGKEYAPTVQIKNSTLIEEAVKKLRKDGFKEIFVVGRHKVLTRIFELLKDGSSYGIKMNYVEEKTANGTADTLKHLKGKINKNFLVVYADVLFNKINISELWNSHIKGDGIATIMLTTHARPKEKGVVKMEGNKVVDFQQKPARSEEHLVFSPIFATGPEILEYYGKSLEKDVFPTLAKKGLLRGHLSSVKEIHIHNEKDIKDTRKLV
ncbi:MAG: hypothetical protein DRM99_05635, partial [Thermoplasmata archaeon]